MFEIRITNGDCMVKDWTGNSVAYSKTLGASSHSNTERAIHDYYATEPKAVRLLLEMERFEGTIWECACGEGSLSNEMIKLGYKVRSSDLINRGYGEVFDFLSVENQHTNYNIITNPPYKYANEFILKAMQILEIDKKVAFFLPIRYTEGKGRKKIFLKYPPKVVYISSSRLKCAMNGKFDEMTGSAVSYAWFVWEKGFTGDTKLKWFN
ncbi:MAG: hypothetical protein DDT22_00239 [candidate division WS2 bacterium]|nr:hypothetical protein [Candidatus Lithacetigena glycinireducens]